MSQSSPVVVWAALLAFSLIALLSICVFGYSAFRLFVDLYVNPSHTVVIDKGSFYLLGVAIGLGALLVDGAAVNVFKRPLSKYASKVVSRVVLIGLVIMILIPHILHYPTANYLELKGYTICQSESSQWMFFRTIVYAQAGYCN